MMHASSHEGGARAATRRSRSAPVRALGRFAGHVLLLACWLLVAVMAALTWGPHATRYKTDIIVGQSMEPTIPLYSVIVVEPVAPERIRKGDVITFQQPDAPERKVTHRVTRVDRRDDGQLAFVTKGDNNEVRDPWRVTYEDTGYVVRGHAPHVGWVMIKAQTRWARVLLVVLPVLLLLGSFLRWVWRGEDTGSDEHDVVDEAPEEELPWELESWPRDRSAA